MENRDVNTPSERFGCESLVAWVSNSHEIKQLAPIFLQNEAHFINNY
jgi:hypothetical protein